MTTHHLTRRAFLQGSTLVIAACATADRSLVAADDAAPDAERQPSDAESVLRIGLMTDLHSADKPTRGSRHYRQSLDKAREAVTRFNKMKVDFAIELGDIVDRADDVETELKYLAAIEAEYAKVNADRYYVLGNHCVDTLTKKEFIAHTAMTRPHLAFEKAGWRFVTLDACFNSKGEDYGRRNFEWTDANIPQRQLDWLKKELAQSDAPAVVFVHQRLDTSNHYAVRNAAAVRQVLEASGRVKLVLQGHSHANDLKEINGIPYCTLAALVEGSGERNNAYAVMNLGRNGLITIDGFRRQSDRTWNAAKASDKG